MSLKGFCLGVLLAGLAASAPAVPAERPIELHAGDRVAMLGDSITAQKSYTRYLETYLELCSGVEGLSFMQFGWPGDTAQHAIVRMPDDVLGYKPTVTTAMFGINDGKYKPYADSIALPYKTNLVTIAKMLKAAGSKALFLSPSTMDPTSGDHAAFMDALGKMSARCREAAAEEGAGFADVNALHEDVQNKLISERGKASCKFAPDGVHDYPLGHFVILAAALDGFALDGNVAELTMDAKSGKATASDGHAVIACEVGKATFESMRYPFCFRPNPKTFGEDIAAALPYVDFQEKHNRFILKVTGLDAAEAKVCWTDVAGKSVTNVFTRAALEKGVNLADAFRDNPFVGPFYAYFDAALDKECFEVDMTCTVIPFAGYVKEVTGKDEKDRFSQLWADLFKEQERRMAELKKLHMPVRHTITLL